MGPHYYIQFVHPEGTVTTVDCQATDSLGPCFAKFRNRSRYWHDCMFMLEEKHLTGDLRVADVFGEELQPVVRVVEQTDPSAMYVMHCEFEQAMNKPIEHKLHHYELPCYRMGSAYLLFYNGKRIEENQTAKDIFGEEHKPVIQVHIRNRFGKTYGVEFRFANHSEHRVLHESEKPYDLYPDCFIQFKGRHCCVNDTAGSIFGDEYSISCLCISRKLMMTRG